MATLCVCALVVRFPSCFGRIAFLIVHGDVSSSLRLFVATVALRDKTSEEAREEVAWKKLTDQLEQLEPVVIAALNQYVFCPRRCALMFVEGIWNDNEHTAIGSLLHDHTDEPGYETEAGVTILRALPLFSERYGLSGKADIVEVRESTPESGLEPEPDLVRPTALQRTSSQSKREKIKSGTRNSPTEIRYAPVEYKKGKRRKWDNDDVQLCAQAFCLEEMFQTEVPHGFIYHAASKRRREVIFDEGLREETRQTIKAVRVLIAKGEVPPAILKPRCDGCSLREVCMPELTGATHLAAEKYERELWS
jgi:CRISPR-associated exonuclease Cas4